MRRFGLTERMLAGVLALSLGLGQADPAFALRPTQPGEQSGAGLEELQKAVGADTGRRRFLVSVAGVLFASSFSSAQGPSSENLVPPRVSESPFGSALSSTGEAVRVLGGTHRVEINGARIFAGDEYGHSTDFQRTWDPLRWQMTEKEWVVGVKGVVRGDRLDKFFVVQTERSNIVTKEYVVVGAEGAYSLVRQPLYPWPQSTPLGILADEKDAKGEPLYGLVGYVAHQFNPFQKLAAQRNPEPEPVPAGILVQRVPIDQYLSAVEKGESIPPKQSGFRIYEGTFYKAGFTTYGETGRLLYGNVDTKPAILPPVYERSGAKTQLVRKEVRSVYDEAQKQWLFQLVNVPVEAPAERTQAPTRSPSPTLKKPAQPVAPPVAVQPDGGFLGVPTWIWALLGAGGALGGAEITRRVLAANREKADRSDDAGLEESSAGTPRRFGLATLGLAVLFGGVLSLFEPGLSAQPPVSGPDKKIVTPADAPVTIWRPTDAEDKPVPLKFETKEDKTTGFLTTTYENKTAYIVPNPPGYGQLVTLDPATNRYRSVGIISNTGEILAPWGRGGIPPAAAAKLPVPALKETLKDWRPAVTPKFKTKVGANGLLVGQFQGRDAYLLPDELLIARVVVIHKDSNDYRVVGYLTPEGVISTKLAGALEPIRYDEQQLLPAPPAVAEWIKGWRPTDPETGKEITLGITTERLPNGLLKGAYKGETVYLVPRLGFGGQLVALQPSTSQYEPVATVHSDGITELPGVSVDIPLQVVEMLPEPDPAALNGWRPTGNDGKPIPLKVPTEAGPNGLLVTDYNGAKAYVVPVRGSYGQLVTIDPFWNDYVSVARIGLDGTVNPLQGYSTDVTAPVLRLLPEPLRNPYKGWVPSADGKAFKLGIPAKEGHNGILTVAVEGKEGTTGYVLPHHSFAGQIVAVDPLTGAYARVASIRHPSGEIVWEKGDTSDLSPAILAQLPPVPRAGAAVAGDVPVEFNLGKADSAGQIYYGYQQLVNTHEKALQVQAQKVRETLAALGTAGPGEKQALEQALAKESKAAVTLVRVQYEEKDAFLAERIRLIEGLPVPLPLHDPMLGFLKESREKLRILADMSRVQEGLHDDFLKLGRILLPQPGGVLTGAGGYDIPYVSVPALVAAPKEKARVEADIQQKIGRLWDGRIGLLKVDERRIDRETKYAKAQSTNQSGVAAAAKNMSRAMDQIGKARTFASKQRAMQDWRDAVAEHKSAEQTLQLLVQQAALLPLDLPVFALQRDEALAWKAVAQVPLTDLAGQAKAQKAANAATLKVLEAKLESARARQKVPPMVFSVGEAAILERDAFVKGAEAEVLKWAVLLDNAQRIDAIGLACLPSIVVPEADLLGNGGAFRGGAVNLMDVQGAYSSVVLANKALADQPGAVLAAHREAKEAEISVQQAIQEVRRAEIAVQGALIEEAQTQGRLNQAKAYQIQVFGNPKAQQKERIDAANGVQTFTKQLGDAQAGTRYQRGQLAKAYQGLQFQQARVQRALEGIDYQKAQQQRYAEGYTRAVGRFEESAFTNFVSGLLLAENAVPPIGWTGLTPAVTPGVAPMPDGAQVAGFALRAEESEKNRLRKQLTLMESDLQNARVQLSVERNLRDARFTSDWFPPVEKALKSSIEVKRAEIALLDAKTVDAAVKARAALNEAILIEEQRRLELIDMMLRDLRPGAYSLRSSGAGFQLSAMVSLNLSEHAIALAAERDRVRLRISQDAERNKRGEPLVSVLNVPLPLPAVQSVIEPLGSSASLAGYVRVHGKEGFLPVTTEGTRQIWLVDPVFESGDRWASGLKFVEQNGLFVPVERTVRISGRAPGEEVRKTHSVYSVGPVGELVTGPFRTAGDGLIISVRETRLGSLIRIDPDDPTKVLVPTHGLVGYTTYENGVAVGVIVRPVDIELYNKQIDGKEIPIPFDPEEIAPDGRRILGTFYRGQQITYGPKGETALGGKKQGTGPLLPPVNERVGAKVISVEKEVLVIYNEETEQLEVTFRARAFNLPGGIQPAPEDQGALPQQQLPEEDQVGEGISPWVLGGAGALAFAVLAGGAYLAFRRSEKSSVSRTPTSPPTDGTGLEESQLPPRVGGLLSIGFAVLFGSFLAGTLDQFGFAQQQGKAPAGLVAQPKSHTQVRDEQAQMLENQAKAADGRLKFLQMDLVRKESLYQKRAVSLEEYQEAIAAVESGPVFAAQSKVLGLLREYLTTGKIPPGADAKAIIAQIDASIENARATVTFFEKHEARYATLVKTNSVSQSEYELAVASLASSKYQEKILAELKSLYSDLGQAGAYMPMPIARLPSIEPGLNIRDAVPPLPGVKPDLKKADQEKLVTSLRLHIFTLLDIEKQRLKVNMDVRYQINDRIQKLAAVGAVSDSEAKEALFLKAQADQLSSLSDLLDAQQWLILVAGNVPHPKGVAAEKNRPADVATAQKLLDDTVVAQTKSLVNLADARVNYRQVEFNRYDALVKKNSVSLSEWEHSRNDLLRAQAQKTSVLRLQVIDQNLRELGYSAAIFQITAIVPSAIDIQTLIQPVQIGFAAPLAEEDIRAKEKQVKDGRVALLGDRSNALKVEIDELRTDAARMQKLFEAGAASKREAQDAAVKLKEADYLVARQDVYKAAQELEKGRTDARVKGYEKALTDALQAELVWVTLNEKSLRQWAADADLKRVLSASEIEFYEAQADTLVIRKKELELQRQTNGTRLAAGVYLADLGQPVGSPSASASPESFQLVLESPNLQLGTVKVHGADQRAIVALPGARWVWLAGPPVLAEPNNWAAPAMVQIREGQPGAGNFIMPEYLQMIYADTGALEGPLSPGSLNRSIYITAWGPKPYQLTSGYYRVEAIEGGVTVDAEAEAIRLGVIIRKDPAGKPIESTHGIVGFATYSVRKLPDGKGGTRREYAPLGVVVQEIPLELYNKTEEGREAPIKLGSLGKEADGTILYGELYSGGLVTYGDKGEALYGKQKEAGQRLAPVFERVGARLVPVEKEVIVLFDEDAQQLKVSFKNHEIPAPKQQQPPVVPPQQQQPPPAEVQPQAEEGISPWTIGGIGALALAVLTGGAWWYFRRGRSSSQTQTPPAPPADAPPGGAGLEQLLGDLEDKALAVVSEQRGLFPAADINRPRVYLFDETDYDGTDAAFVSWAPVIAKTGVPVAVLTRKGTVAEGLKKLFRQAGISEDRFEVVSIEDADFGSDKQAALEALSRSFDGVDFTPVAPSTGFEIMKRILEEMGFTFYIADFKVDFERVEEYLSSLA